MPTPQDDSDAFINAAEAAAIQDAIDGTSNEIFNAGFGKEDDDDVIDETGDRSLEALGEGLEGEILPPDDEAVEGEETGETEPKPRKDETEKEPVAAKPGEETPAAEPQGTVPPAVHRKALERARAAEAERDGLKTSYDELKGQFGTLSAKLDGLISGLSRPQQKTEAETKPEAEVIPDILEDPRGYAEYLSRRQNASLQPVLQALENSRVETSMGLAHARHGQAFDSAMEAIGKLNPQNAEHVVQVQRIYRSPNPGEALVSWHKRNVALAEVGDDPSKYRERIASELRNDPTFIKSVIEAAQAQANGNGSGRPNTTIKVPRSLNGASGSSARTDDGIAGISGLDDQQGIFDSVWSDR